MNTSVVVKINNIEEAKVISIVCVDYDRKHNMYNARECDQKKDAITGDLVWNPNPEGKRVLTDNIKETVGILRNVIKNSELDYKFFSDKGDMLSCIIFTEPTDKDSPLAMDLTSIDTHVFDMTPNVLLQHALGTILDNMIKQYKDKYPRIIESMKTAVYDDTGVACRDVNREKEENKK